MKYNKKYVKLAVILVFCFFFCILFSNIKRSYTVFEKGFKTVNMYVNDIFINKLYKEKSSSKNIINSKIKYLEKENNTLKKDLEIKSNNPGYVFSKVVNHNLANWSYKLEIDSGYKKGVENNLPVINEEGLVGFITKTSKYVSEVSLITDINSDNMKSVIILSDDKEVSGILSYYDNKKGLFKVSNVISKQKIKAGDDVCLSGYNNDLYKGIYIGKVVKEEKENYGLSRSIWVESNVNFNDLLYLFVVVDKEIKK